MATRRKLENDIVEVLSCSAERRLPLSELKQYLPVESDKLAETLTELVRNGVVKRSGEMYRFPTTIEKKRRPSMQERRLLVAQCVSGAREPPTTAEIATDLSTDSKQVYQICRRFEKKRFLRKGPRKPREKPLFFAPIIGQTMHGGNYELIMRLYRELREIIKRFGLKDRRLEARLHRFLADELQGECARYAEAITAFIAALISAIKGAETKGEVYEFLGLRPFYPEVCTWEPWWPPGPPG